MKKIITIISLVVLSVMLTGCDNVVVEESNMFYDTCDSVFNYASIVHMREVKEKGSTGADHEYYNMGGGNFVVSIKHKTNDGQMSYEYGKPVGKQPIMNMTSTIGSSVLILTINGDNVAFQMAEGSIKRIAMLLDGEYMAMGWNEEEAAKVKEFVHDRDLIRRYTVSSY